VLAVSLTIASEHNSFDNDPWILKLVDFTKKVLDQHRVRLIGVCYGHQIIGRALGMKVGRGDNGWETSVCSVKLSKKGEEVFKKDTLVSIFSSISIRTLMSCRAYIRCIETLYMAFQKEWPL